MTKERLEELIKQGEMIYDVGNGTVRQIDLSEHGVDNYYIAESNYLALNSRRPYMTVYAWDIECLYETKEQAEWALKTVAERTERFEPPMWDDLLEKDLYVFTFVKDRDVYEFICNIYLDKVDIRLERGLTGYGVEPIIDCEFGNATKENYEKACEIVRDLFKGEK